jgi:hypothetical protein
MKYLTLAVACLINNTSAIDLKHKNKQDDEAPPTPVAWLKDTLPACPDDANRTIMDDGKTHIVKFPYVGAVCML